VDLLPDFLKFIDGQQLFQPKQRLLLAVSGGLDSMVLVDLCRRAGIDFGIAHCHFGLRGAESDGDAAFVHERAKELKVPVFIRSFDTRAYMAEHSVSVQVAARELRYAWFRELAAAVWEEVDGEWAAVSGEPSAIDSTDKAARPSPFTAPPQPTCILTAHHRDDHIETVLINFFRGTGIAGMHGIRAKQENLVRPLLFASREQLHTYAVEQNLSWREDSSNTETKYLRNALRLEVLPAMEKVFPGVRKALHENAQRFAEVEQLYRKAVEEQLLRLQERRGQEVRIPVRRLRKATPLDTLIWELMRPYGFGTAQTAGLRALLDSPSGRYLQSATHRVVRHGAWLLVAPLTATDTSVYVLDEKEQGSISFGNHLLEWRQVNKPEHISADASMALLDARLVDFPLILRRWKPGDYFYPLGMRKKKKLARFFIDSKLSKLQKEEIWVLESHKRIVWIAGHRIDDRFKMTPPTRRVLELRLRPLNGSTPF